MLGFLAGLPLLASTVTFLLLARLVVVRRAFAQPRNLLLALFKRLDRLFWSWNDRLARGIVLVKDAASLPGDDSIAWRETTKKSLGTARYLFRVFVALEVPTGVVCMLISLSNANTGLEGATILMFLLWVIAALLISVTSTSLIASERSHETLDVLLSTPITSRELIRQKFRGVRRLMLMLAVPLLTVVFFEAWWKGEFSSIAYGIYGYGRRFNLLMYLVCSLLTIAVYFPLIAWLSFYVGLRVRTQARAIIGSLAALVGWCVAPWLLLFPFAILLRPRNESPFSFLTLFSPATIIPMNEFGDIERMYGLGGNVFEDGSFFPFAWLAILLNFGFYTAAFLMIRHLALTGADRLLGRGDSEGTVP